MKGIFQFSLQDYKQISIDLLLLLLLLLLLNALHNLHPICSFLKLNLLKPFMIDIGRLYLDRRQF